MADLCQKQGFLDKASPLLEEVVSARERVQGRDHPDVASALNNRAALLENQVSAVRKFQEFSCGTRLILGVLNNRAALLEKQVRAVRKFQENCSGVTSIFVVLNNLVFRIPSLDTPRLIVFPL